MIDAQAKRTKIAKIYVQRCLLPRVGVFIEEVGDGKFNSIACRAIYGGSKKCREGRNRKLGYRIVLTKSVKEGVLELGYKSRSV